MHIELSLLSVAVCLKDSRQFPTHGATISTKEPGPPVDESEQTCYNYSVSLDFLASCAIRGHGRGAGLTALSQNIPIMILTIF